MKAIVMILLYLGSTSYIMGQQYYSVNHLLTKDKSFRTTNPENKVNALIPFRLTGGLIMVDSRVNSEEGAYIFDTGAPAILINKKNIPENSDDGTIIGINGSMNMKSVLVKDFQMGQLKKKNMEGIEIDMSSIERLKNQKINGIIGVNACNNTEVLIDYDKKHIEILPRKYEKSQNDRERIASVKFYMDAQLPVIKVKIGKKSFFFGVDTGAEVNVIDQTCAKRIKEFTHASENEKKLGSVSPEKYLAQAIILQELKIQKQHFTDIEMVRVDLSEFNENNTIRLDGILGYPFLKDNLISFDFRRFKLNFWKEN